MGCGVLLYWLVPYLTMTRPGGDDIKYSQSSKESVGVRPVLVTSYGGQSIDHCAKGYKWQRWPISTMFEDRQHIVLIVAEMRAEGYHHYLKNALTLLHNGDEFFVRQTY
jgi:hypothetical protein